MIGGGENPFWHASINPPQNPGANSPGPRNPRLAPRGLANPGRTPEGLRPMEPRIGGPVRTGELGMGAEKPRTGAERTGAEKPRIGAENPRPCPEAAIASPKLNAANSPISYILLTIDLGRPEPSQYKGCTQGSLGCKPLADCGAPWLPSSPASVLYVSLVRPRQTSPEGEGSDPGSEPGLAQAKNENPSGFCPICSARLESHKCKLRCPTCGYYMSCSDYY